MRNLILGTLVVAFVGCGGGKSDFVGTWSETGSLTATCGSHTQTSTISGNTTLVEGTDADLVSTSSNGCNIKFNVSGNVATAVAGQSCTSGNTTFTITTDVITLSSDKKSFTQTVAATADANGTACSVSGTTSDTKIGK